MIFFFLFFDFFLNFFCFFGIPLKITKVRTKSYQGYYWAPKIAKNGPKQHNKLSSKAWSPPQELDVGPHSGPYLLVQVTAQTNKQTTYKMCVTNKKSTNKYCKAVMYWPLWNFQQIVLPTVLSGGVSRKRVCGCGCWC